jgi:hypothetical protein
VHLAIQLHSGDLGLRLLAAVNVMSLASYVSDPLPSPTLLRLIRIFRADSGDLEIVPFPTELGIVPQFGALSYTWGGP